MSNDTLSHIGTKYYSGRYPYGSGNNAFQRNSDFRGYVNQLKQKGLSEKERAIACGFTTTAELRKAISLSRTEERSRDQATVAKMYADGMTATQIGEKLGKNESSIRALLDPTLKAKNEITNATVNALKDAVADRGLIDVGVGSELYLGVSRTKLKTAIAKLTEEGYNVNYVTVNQLGTSAGHKTSIMTLSGPDTNWKDVYSNVDSIRMVTDYHTEDGGRTWGNLEYPTSVDSKRVAIRYSEEGGTAKDGVIELRRGVEDISLGKSSYAQVRIAVDGTHYLKGMAMYSDNLPDGVDIMFNTNKSKTVPKMSVLKNMKIDKNTGEVDADNPFGAVIKANGQRHYVDANGNKQLSAINKVNEEGDWKEWSKSLSSQMLSKQSIALAQKQLKLSYDIAKDEYDEICQITNPVIKKKLLAALASSCDSDAVHLKAAGMPRQSSHVILPITDMEPTEVYAPNFRDGESVVLIRYPHGGTFEIPNLVVNNKQKTAKQLLGRAQDAIGISAKTAEQLSGADFDGDTVLVIPNPGGKTIKTQPTLKGLANFDPKESYKGYEGMPKMTPQAKGREMGGISNLITDMTIAGASTDEMCRAVKHSMVVIDAEKHGLNYKQSAQDNQISALKIKYQGKANAGAATLISKASSDKRVALRKDQFKIDPKTGAKIYENKAEESYTTINKKTGKETKVVRTTKIKRMDDTDDAFTLSSGTQMEATYAKHANQLKALANTARKEELATPKQVYSPSANKVYSKEVAQLKSKLNVALKNAPKERQAQILANAQYKAKKLSNPDMSEEEQKKLKYTALAEARTRVGASKTLITIDDNEWAAIQAGAISDSTLTQIISNTDIDVVKQLATPRTKSGITSAKETRAKAMYARGYTQSEIASALGVSVNLLSGLDMKGE